MKAFFKPLHLGTLYQQHIPELSAVLSIRSLDLARDGDLLHDWVNQSYAKKFWQLNGSRQLLGSTYQAILDNPQSHSFMIELDHQPIGQVDLYTILIDELAQHIDANPSDCGLHILMCPPRQLQRGWSVQALKNFTRFYFGHHDAGILFAEPDAENAPANKLALDTGFMLLKTIELSYKTANLYYKVK